MFTFPKKHPFNPQNPLPCPLSSPSRLYIFTTPVPFHSSHHTANGRRVLEDKLGAQRGQQDAQVCFQHGAPSRERVWVWAGDDLLPEENEGLGVDGGGGFGADASPSGRGAQRQRGGHEPLAFCPSAEEIDDLIMFMIYHRKNMQVLYRPFKRFFCLMMCCSVSYKTYDKRRK